VSEARNFPGGSIDCRKSVRTSGREPRALGVYVHFPYCLRKCAYCDFVSFKTEPTDIPHEKYADAVVAELEARTPSVSGHRLSTVFIGGGTPSLWDVRALGRVIRAIEAAFAGRSEEEVEITAECNPTSFDIDKAKQLRDAGVNRLSIGIQSLEQERLTFLGREHRAEEGLRALESALASGMPRVSGDLIFGVATEGSVETPEVAAAEAKRVAETGVTHVSAYALTIEPNTEFGARARKGKLPLAPDDLIVDSLHAVSTALGELGFAHYETSNYARLGHVSRHNVGYWRGLDYLGLGASAFGTLSRGSSAVRYRNASDPRKYMAHAHDAEEVTFEREELLPNDRMNERIMLGLRLAEGIDLEEAALDLGIDPLPAERQNALRRLIDTGRIAREGNRLRVPQAMRGLVDGISASLFG